VKAPIKLKLKLENGKTESKEAKTIAFDRFGLNYQDASTSRIHVVDYRELKSWEAAGEITEIQKESAAQMEKLHD
jgi:hypothetical protein